MVIAQTQGGTMQQVVSYIRVSTNGQGKSGLRSEAQREAIARFCAAEGMTIASEFKEIETGKGADALVPRVVDIAGFRLDQTSRPDSRTRRDITAESVTRGTS
jgi:hypothetical protein